METTEGIFARLMSEANDNATTLTDLTEFEPYQPTVLILRPKGMIGQKQCMAIRDRVMEDYESGIVVVDKTLDVFVINNQGITKL